MHKDLLSLLFLLCLSTLAAQSVDTDLYRTINGQHNNQEFHRRNWGRSFTPLLRAAANGFDDGFAAPAGPDRPNARAISNALFAQEGLLNDPVGLSDFTWVFGQFIDHDLGLTEQTGEAMLIPVPRGDVNFDPFNTGRVMIPLHRNAPILGTGTGPGNPRQYDNEITAFIDGSAVYGSDDHRAEWLRSHRDGKLKVSEGNFLPYNTRTGEASSSIDRNAPHMANATGQFDRFFVAGDVRANENPLLLSFHTLFVREHNRQCELIQAENPNWTDEQIYQHARKLVGGLIQSIVYDEWLPVMGIPMAPYTGYDPGVNPQLYNEFSAAAFRVGHTLLNGNLRRVDERGQVLPEGNISLKDAFFNPRAFTEVGGMEPYLRGMAEQTQQQMDNRIVDDVRNFLFGPPGAGGLDLAAINIMRGRERGLGSYNSIRLSFRGEGVYSFAKVNPDPEVYEALEEIYEGDVNKIDPWVGMLAERPMEGSIFGPTIQAIMQQQFTNLRNGDRFFYLNDPVLSQQEKEYIRNTTFRDVIMHNTTIELMQENVFKSKSFSEICGSTTITVDGLVSLHTSQAALPGVTVNAETGTGSVEASATTTEYGFYDFSSLVACGATGISAQRDDEWITGIDIFDIVTIQRFILGIDPLENPYQYLAADANQDQQIDVRDIVTLIRLVLRRSEELAPAPATPWVFIPAAYTFSDPTNPFADDYPRRINFGEVDPAEINQGFVGVKLGDVDASYRYSEFADRGEGLTVGLPATEFAAGDQHTVTLTLTGEQLGGYQFDLRPMEGRILSVVSTDLPQESYLLDRQGVLHVATTEVSGHVARSLTLRLESSRDARLSEILKIERPLVADSKGKARGLRVATGPLPSINGVTVAPNPFSSELNVTFSTPLSASATLLLTDVTGREVARRAVHAGAGGVTLDGLELPAGSYTLRVVTKVTGELVTLRQLVAR